MSYLFAFVLLGLLIVVASLGRSAWRLWRGDEEAEPGGSLGDQLFGRWNTPRPK